MSLPVFNLSNLDGSNGFRLDGEKTHSYTGFGRSVNNAGDVNGDGFDDVIVGAWLSDSSGKYSGSSYVVFGKASGIDAQLDLSSLNGSNGFRLDGETDGDGTGWLVNSAGDVNGDGFDDVIVGGNTTDPYGYNFGSVYVVFGKSSGFDAHLDLSSLDGESGFRFYGADVGSQGGYAGDVNGDGFDDISFNGATNDPSLGSGTGYVLFGKASGFVAARSISSLDSSDGFSLIGAAGAVSDAGDVNGDGLDDLLTGNALADNNGILSGSSYVMFGRSSGFDSAVDFSNLDGSNGFRLDGESYDVSGFPVSTAGDINGDGFDDVIIGAPFADSNGEDAGSIYVVFGATSGFDAHLDLSSLDGSNGFRLDGAAKDRLGFSLSGAGDVNGDGFDDLIVGTPYTKLNSFDSGSSYIVFGKASGFTPTMELSNLDENGGFRINGEHKNASLGQSVSGAGDVNGDGLDDLIIGAPGATFNGSGSGSSYIIFGSRDFGNGGGGGSELPEIIGTAADDTLKGTTAAEHFIAGEGNDNLIGLGGADIFDAGAGDDAIRIGDLTFASIDGGEGNDALHLAGSGMDLDLSVFGDQIHNIETICLYGRGDNTLTLTADSLLNLSDSTNTLKVHGNSGDHVVVQDSGWVDGGSQGFYHSYTHDDAVLLVGANVTVELV